MNERIKELEEQATSERPFRSRVMTPAQVKRKAANIHKNIKKWNEALESLQEECPHINAIHTDRADTGNWCKSDDRYWTVHECMDCGKHWTTDQ